MDPEELACRKSAAEWKGWTQAKGSNSQPRVPSTTQISRRYREIDFGAL
jgi:hypothetical protein